MQIKGNHTFSTSSQSLWNHLLNPEILARITPGVSELEQIEEDRYKAIAVVKIGPVKGSFTGDLEIADKKAPNSFVLKLSQKSKVGNVAADVLILLEEKEENQTTLSFDTKAKLSGLLARTGQRVLSGVAKSLSKQFFKALEEELQQSA